MKRHASLRLAAAVVVVLASWGANPSPARELDLEAIFGAPFASSLVAAREGGRLAWVFNERGARNVWVAEPPGYRGRSITAYGEDDGQELSGLAWAPDGRRVVFVRGGDANRAGEYPNPTHEPQGVEQAVWIASADGTGEGPVKLGEGHSPAVSPRGDRVAFVREGQIWWAPLDGSTEAEQLLHARGSAGTLRWSPDGARLAFVSERGDHSFIGVYTLETGSLNFLDPSVDRDRSPVWSPDGARLAFVRLPAKVAPYLFGPDRAGQPWSIRVADVATREGREIFRASDGIGSVFREVVGEDVLWGASDELAFPWEKDGWTHLYAVSVEGGEPRLLTPGEFEVEYVALTPDRRYVVYNSNQEDVDRRHLWRVPVAGGGPERLTEGDGIEWAPVVTSDGSAVAFLRSSARRPSQPAIQPFEGEARLLAPEAIPASFPGSELIEPRQVVFSSADGKPIHAQLFLPSDLRPDERRPAVVFFHGGSRRQMLLGWHYMEYYHNTYAFNQYLTSRGYVVLSVNYRSGIGYGMAFREALDYGATGASELNDVLGAGLYLRSRADVDPEHIGSWGGSYGGYLTALALARASDLFAAGVDLHGVHDWNPVIRNFQPSYDPLEHPEFAKLAFESSPLAFVDGWRSPVLLVHGDDDRNVPFSESVRLAEELRRRGVEVEQLIFPDEIHDFLRTAHWIAAFERAAAFLDRHLRPPAAETRADTVP